MAAGRPSTNNTTPRFDRFALIVLAVGLVLRILIVEFHYHGIRPAEIAGDSEYYINVASEPWRLGLPGLTGPEDAQPPEYVRSIGPAYPLYMIVVQRIFRFLSLSNVMLLLDWYRLTHTLLDIGLAAMVYALADRLFGRQVGRVALVAQAFDPRYIYHVGIAQTELLFITLFVGFMLLFIRGMEDLSPGRLRWAGVVLGLAVLTRPVPLLFPVLLAVYAFFHPESRRQAFQGLAWTVGLMVLVITPWFTRTFLLTNEVIPIVSSAFTHFWLTTRDDGREADTNFNEQREDDGLIQEDRGTPQGTDFVQAGVDNIVEAPAPFVVRIVRDTALAFAQPYGTTFARPPGTPSALRTGLDVLRGDAPLTEFTSLPGIAPRMLMYAWQYWAIIGGAAGVVIALREKNLWRPFPLYAWVAYATAVTSVLLIEPRYVFPIMFALTVLSSLATVRAFEALRARTTGLSPAEGAASAR